MKLTPLCALFAAATLSLSGVSHAGATAKTYQVTGPILEINDTFIAVQKGKDRWEISKDATAKINGALKVGAKVTITYTMIASQVDVKPDKAAATADKAAAKK